MFEKIKRWFSSTGRDEELQKQLEKIREKTPVPVFWLFGKTQSGKTSIVKYLTGAEEAEIGQGFKPCTKFSQQYDFPTAEAPLLKFLDTRGVDEPEYDSSEDIKSFHSMAHVVIVTIKITDHALESVEANLRKIRKDQSDRPVVLVLTCLHEAILRQQHPQPYTEIDWLDSGEATKSQAPPEKIKTLVAEQKRRFADLYDHIVLVDLTKPEEGFADSEYGGQHLKDVLLDALPNAYRQSLVTLEAATGELSDLYARHALPHIIAYSSMAAAAGAIPIPGVDLLVVPGIQTRMIYHLAQFYGQKLTGERFLELASTLGLGMLVRQAARQVVKFIPGVGSVAGATLAFAATFALGKAFCYYYSAVHKGQVPSSDDLKKYYREQLVQAEQMWRQKQLQTNENSNETETHNGNPVPTKEI